jgi:hypothetical protein
MHPAFPALGDHHVEPKFYVELCKRSMIKRSHHSQNPHGPVAAGLRTWQRSSLSD